MNRIYVYLLMPALSVLFVLGGCSTTRRLTEDEVLYTGVRKITINRPEENVPRSVISAVREPLSARPNNPLISPYIRTPLPIGLWAWNYLYTPEQRGFGHWLYRRLAKEPVLISMVNPKLRSEMANHILENNGYFNASTSYEIIPARRNSRKARISYTVNIPPPWFYDNITRLSAKGSLGRAVDSLMRTSLLSVGEQYNLNTLIAERDRISTALRQKGYYYFRPQFIEYLADTTRQERKVDLLMRFRGDTPPAALKAYNTGKIYVTMHNSIGGEWDSLSYKGVKIFHQKPLKVRPGVLVKNIPLKQGTLLTVADQEATQTNLTKLGIFRLVDLQVPPLNSLKGNEDSLDITINVALDKPLFSELEVNVSSKSNSFVGPGASFSVQHNNLFRGAEVLTVKLAASYEWQTGSKRQIEADRSLVNSYELRFSTSLSYPRLIAPAFISRSPRFPTRTVFELGASLLSRSGFFKMASFDGSVTYDFQSSPYSYHSLAIPHLVYNKLITTTAKFDRIMAENPAIALSFQSHFIPSIRYTYTYDRTFGRKERTRLFWQGTAVEAGNILAGTFRLFGQRGAKNIFGNPFSQFVKGISDLRVFRSVGKNSLIATRLIVGAGHAYGNSQVLPYSEQFYIGGANSIRAFTIRSLGPGSFRPSGATTFGYFDQTGEFKLEANVEYRFRITGRLNGAVFVDAGNIWLLKEDPARPGGKLRWPEFWNEVALGTGAGLRYDLGFFVIRADLGIGLHTPYKNPATNRYFNVTRFGDVIGFHLAIGYPF